MKYLITLGLVVILTSCNTKNESADLVLDTDEKMFSYALGMDIGEGIKSQKRFDTIVDSEIMIMGLNDVYKDSANVKMTKDSARNFLVYYTMPEDKKKVVKENRLRSADFIKSTKKEDGITATKSGLLYKQLKAGEGVVAKESDIVKVRYTGKLPNGEVFDTTEQKGRGPIEFPVNGVIQGWKEGLQLMNKGSKFRLVIPANLAYGIQAPPQIGPDQALDFEVEVLDITSSPAETEQALEASKAE